MERKSRIWMKSFVSPPLARRTVSTSLSSPGRKRSCPMRRRGPLLMSRTPVASTTIAPGFPRAKRSYHLRLDSVTNPSSVARQGTIAGTQVRARSSRGPIRMGRNQSDFAASSSVGQRPSGSRCRIRSDGVHISCSVPRGPTPAACECSALRAGLAPLAQGADASVQHPATSNSLLTGMSAAFTSSSI